MVIIKVCYNNILLAIYSILVDDAKFYFAICSKINYNLTSLGLYFSENKHNLEKVSCIKTRFIGFFCKFY